MYLWSSVVVFVTILGHQLHICNCNSIILDCGVSDRLCPGVHMIELECDTGSTAIGVLWEYADDYEVDFHGSYAINSTECDKGSDKAFCGKLIQKYPTYKTTLQFQSSLTPEGSLVYCSHLASDPEIKKSCRIAHMDPPSPPSNLISSLSQSSVQLSWSSSSSNSTNDNNGLYYHITISSNNSTTVFTTTKNNLDINITDYHKDLVYTATVKTVTCDGNLPGNAVSTINFSIPTIHSTFSIQPTNTVSTNAPQTTKSQIALDKHTSLNNNTQLLSLSTSSSSQITLSTSTPSSHTSTTTQGSITSSTLSHPTEDDSEFDSYFMPIIAGAIGGLLVLIVIAIILVAFAFIIVAILKRMNPPIAPHPSSTPCVSVLPTVAISHAPVPSPPPPLPPRPNASIDIELKTTTTTSTSPQYENPLQMFSSQSKESNNKNETYAIPFVGRILFPNNNSKTSFV